MIFQGQEFLDQEPFVQEPIPPLNWSDATNYVGILQLYRDLIQLRRDWHDTTRGLRGDGLNVFHVNNSDKLIAYHRSSEGGPQDDVVIALKFANRGYNNYTIGLPAPASGASGSIATGQAMTLVRELAGLRHRDRPGSQRRPAGSGEHRDRAYTALFQPGSIGTRPSSGPYRPELPGLRPRHHRLYEAFVPSAAVEDVPLKRGDVYIQARLGLPIVP